MQGPHLVCWVMWHTPEPRRSAASGECAAPTTALQNTGGHVPRLPLRPVTFPCHITVGRASCLWHAGLGAGSRCSACERRVRALPEGSTRRGRASGTGSVSAADRSQAAASQQRLCHRTPPRPPTSPSGTAETPQRFPSRCRHARGKGPPKHHHLSLFATARFSPGERHT